MSRVFSTNVVFGVRISVGGIYSFVVAERRSHFLPLVARNSASLSYVFDTSVVEDAVAIWVHAAFWESSQLRPPVPLSTPGSVNVPLKKAPWQGQSVLKAAKD
jgi:hypothetical protein